jgi:hypothetical protein
MVKWAAGEAAMSYVLVVPRRLPGEVENNEEAVITFTDTRAAAWANLPRSSL